MNPTVFTTHFAAAVLFGAVIGAERQWRQRTAGLRTHALVCCGAAMFVLLGRLVSANNPDSTLRVAAQIVSGIGFLGGGLIFREGLSVRGLNTAATLWCSAAVGAFCGAGFLLEAAIGVGGVLTANLLLRPLANLIQTQPPLGDHDMELLYLVRVKCTSNDEAHLRALLLSSIAGQDLALRSLHSEQIPSTGSSEIRATLRSHGKQDTLLERLAGLVSSEPCVTAVSWEVTLHGDVD
jgi:putative Mg2+ transporter-C (MgtC) family protein